MPLASNVRKASTATMGAAHDNDGQSAPRRTTSGRAVRANTTRPTNYYSRPFDTVTANALTSAMTNIAVRRNPEPGFFPGLQFFSDAITALPKEVMRQFTLMKEVEAKIHGPNEKLEETVDELMQYPVPSRTGTLHATVTDGQGLLSFTAHNSVTGSASASLVNGNAPNSASGSVNGEDMAQSGGDDDLEKRRKFHEMRMLTHNLLPNLDEKNVVLGEANRVLAQQLSRLDSVLPHVDEEISEDARLGSMTHWAYSDNRQKKQTGGMLANRRDVAATHSLAAAASAIHESDIAQARRDAVRETAREKHKGKSREHLDSDFEERPKKTHAKIAKSKAAGQTLGVSSNGELVKKRKIDKGLSAPGMERSLSAVSKAGKVVKETSRSTPVGETGRKAGKAKPLPAPARKKAASSAQGSPALASSPLHASFNAASIEPPVGRSQNPRLRQNSAATNLRHERLLEEENSRPTSAPSRVNGEKANGKRKAPPDSRELGEYERAKSTTERDDGLNQEESYAAENAHASRSNSNSGKAGRGSHAGTPKTESFPDAATLLRMRNTRSARGTNEESSSEPQGGHRHKRNPSNSHLVKQLAPFNRSPDLGRRRHDDMDEDLDSADGAARGDREEVDTSHSPPKRQSRSRRNTGNLIPVSSPPSFEPDGDEGDAIMGDPDGEADHTDPSEVPDLEADIPPASNDLDMDDDIDDDDSEEPGDPDDPDEPKYCYCNRGSYGEMIACDNEQCAREWFHLGCTGLREPPDEAAKWYCEECKPLFVVERERHAGRGGRGRGRGASRK